jgi:hypothetical protein
LFLAACELCPGGSIDAIPTSVITSIAFLSQGLERCVRPPLQLRSHHCAGNAALGSDFTAHGQPAARVSLRTLYSASLSRGFENPSKPLCPSCHTGPYHKCKKGLATFSSMSLCWRLQLPCRSNHQRHIETLSPIAAKKSHPPSAPLHKPVPRVPRRRPGDEAPHRCQLSFYSTSFSRWRVPISTVLLVLTFKCWAQVGTR